MTGVGASTEEGFLAAENSVVFFSPFGDVTPSVGGHLDQHFLGFDFLGFGRLSSEGFGGSPLSGHPRRDLLSGSRVDVLVC